MYTLECGCGREHTANIKEFVNRSGAMDSLGDILGSYKSIYIVADENTYRAAGFRACQILKEAGHRVKKCVLKTPVLPNDETVGAVIMEIPRYTDFILAVGSGTINDTCRVVSHKLGLTYGVLCTAPSMDGYASNISPMIRHNTKVTIHAHPPIFIISDIDIVRSAPARLVRAGLGDMAGKYIAILDWRLSALHTGEYYCGTVAQMVLNAADKCLSMAKKAVEGDGEAAGLIMEGLVQSGLGMAYTGVSRPASGSEHMIGHTWEVMDIEKGHTPQLHGLEVAQGTAVSAYFYKRLYKECKDIKLKMLIEGFLPRLNSLAEIYAAAGIEPVVTQKDKFLTGIKRAPKFRNRYTILKYLEDKGLYNEYAEAAGEELLRI